MNFAHTSGSLTPLETAHTLLRHAVRRAQAEESPGLTLFLGAGCSLTSALDQVHITTTGIVRSVVEEIEEGVLSRHFSDTETYSVVVDERQVPDTIMRLDGETAHADEHKRILSSFKPINRSKSSAVRPP